MAVKNKQASRSLRMNAEIAEIPVGKAIRHKKKAEPSGSTLYYGDNLSVLRDHIASASVDLIYLDPPFNSNANYNVLFSSPKGHQSGAQIEAFEDTWHWGEQAEKEFDEILTQANTQVAEVLRALRQFLGENDMMAYLVMMANRLLELHRVLKPTGSLYLHCDPTASHYLKIILDAVFGVECYRNEITWKRTTTHSDSKTWSRNSDSIYFYSKGPIFTWNTPRDQHSPEYLASKYRYDDKDGRGLYRLDNMTSPNPRPNMMYEWKGFPFPEKGWRFEPATMKKLDDDGRIWYPTKNDKSYDLTKRPQIKRYLVEMEGGVMGCVWTDIHPVNSQAQERLGYPTQKPLALLDRILKTSSVEGNVVLDPFCGCGTAVHAAQNLGRNWIGIDLTHLAITLIEKRLKGAFPRIDFDVQGTPKDYDGARDLAERDKYQFQWWACSLVNAQPYGGKKKGADGGVDGLIFFQDDAGMSKKIIVSVKGGENLGVTMVKDLIATLARQKAEIGLFVTLNAPTKPMIAEAVSAGFYKSPSGATYPRIQILEIADLLGGTQSARYPRMDAGSLTFKKTTVEPGEDKQKDLFGGPGGKRMKRRK